MKRKTKEMTPLERCQLLVPRLQFYMDAVFGKVGDVHNCSVEVNTDNDPVVLVDGWLEAAPGWGFTDEVGLVSGKLLPDVPTWSLCEIHHIPQTRWEPADVDTKDVGDFEFRGLVNKLVERATAARLNNAGEYEQDQEQAEAEKELYDVPKK